MRDDDDDDVFIIFFFIIIFCYYYYYIIIIILLYSRVKSERESRASPIAGWRRMRILSHWRLRDVATSAPFTAMKNSFFTWGNKTKSQKLPVSDDERTTTQKINALRELVHSGKMNEKTTGENTKSYWINFCYCKKEQILV